MSDYDPAGRKRAAKAAEYHVPGDSKPLAVGDLCWDNNLDVVKIVEIAASVHGMPAEREPGLSYPVPTFCHPEPEVAWHETERVSDGRRSQSDAGTYGRLAYSFDGHSAAAAAELGAGNFAEYRTKLGVPSPGSLM
jgi:hypothetical protein